MNNQKPMNVVGIMSGTSLDGVDFVLTKLGGKKPVFKEMASVNFPKKLREKLILIAEGKMNFRESQIVHFELGEFYNKSLEKIKKNKNWKFDLIGLHGQTVFHQAPQATTQIGEPSFLKSFNVPVVSDFRSKIISAGGQGAPLAPIFHKEIMSDKHTDKTSWGFLNIGGMANLTHSKNGKLFATDLGPGNIFLDKAAKLFLNKNFDKGGVLACKGLPDLSVVKSFVNETAFFNKKTPKSCGREEFSDQVFTALLKKMKNLSHEDQMATLAEITLAPICKFLKTNSVADLVVAGGGVHNKYLMRGFTRELSGTELSTSDSAGWPSQAVEGGAFAHLAYLKVSGQAVDLSYMGLKKKLSPLGRID
jgi:anhydro-N-acetylmuramic acid kinase